MTAKESKAVACTCADHVAGETGYVTFSAPVPFGTKLALQSALHAAEAELGELRSFLDDVEEYLADRSDVIDGDDGFPAPNREMSMLTELRQLLASDGGADGDSEGERE